MTVVYYLNTYYLDAALEIIQSIKHNTDLHILIEISPESKKTNILNVENLSGLNFIEKPVKVMGLSKWIELQKYFKGVKSINFIVFRHKRSFSLSSFYTAYFAQKYINSLNPEIIHFDSITPRIIFMSPFIYFKKTFITVHDPAPHTGEGSWKIKLTEYIYFLTAKGVFFYSKFASMQFKNRYKNLLLSFNLLQFQPFTFIQRYLLNNSVSEGNFILFFGRILAYKGVDILLDAIPYVLSKFPQEKFLIAGSIQDCDIDISKIHDYGENVQLFADYVSTEKLASLIQESKFVVCPYRDATQSGVLMTAFALGKTVVGTNVGAFPEYIRNNVNGIITNPDAISFADAIIDALTFNKYKTLEKNVVSAYSSDINLINKNNILKAYQAI